MGLYFSRYSKSIYVVINDKKAAYKITMITLTHHSISQKTSTIEHRLLPKNAITIYPVPFASSGFPQLTPGHHFVGGLPMLRLLVRGQELFGPIDHLFCEHVIFHFLRYGDASPCPYNSFRY